MRAHLLFLFTGSCLALTKLEEDVVAAMKNAADTMKSRNSQIKTIPYDKNHMQSQKANVESTQRQSGGDWLAETTKILIAKHGVGVLSQLEKINVTALRSLAIPTSNRTKRQANRNCPTDDTNCNSQRNTDFRSISGVCNNRLNRNLGAAVTPVRRILGVASYSDGLGEIRSRSINRVALLPSTRDVSNRLHSEGARPVYDSMTNHLHMQMGQFIAHDIIFMPSSVGPNGENLDCDACNAGTFNPNCAPITVPENDAYFPRNSCIRLTRALNGQQGLGQRTQVNQNTQFLDLSSAYGSEACEAASVRSFRNGELLEFNLNGDILPPQHKNDTNCQSVNPLFCFLAGDFRSLVQPGLIPFHAAYVKLHNYLAREMRKARPEWDDEKTFQEARRLNTAMFQHHIYNEYLPKLLGPNVMREFGLSPATQGYFTGYNETINPSLSAEFTGAAFRFGHSQARRDLPRVNNNNQSVAGSIDIGSNVFYSDSIYQSNAGGVGSIMDGLYQNPAMTVDREFAFSMRNQIFELRGRKASGVDLVSVNIMRGRDIGLFPYNVYREIVGLARANNFDALISEMDRTNIDALRSVYADVEDIDLYSGILMERPANGAMLGRTGAYIIADAFRNLKQGDRFFYESQVRNSRGFSPEELAAIRNTSLSKVFCMVTPQMKLVARDAFNLNGPRVSCDSLPAINLRPFTIATPSAAPQFKDACPRGWSQNGASCYFFSDDSLDFADAKQYCESHYFQANLASVTSAAENDFIYSLSQAKYGNRPFNPNLFSYWIGARSQLNNGNPIRGPVGQFNWTDGSAFNYTNWSRGNPDNFGDGEPCVEAYEANERGFAPGTWNDQECSRRIHYVCKKPATRLQTTGSGKCSSAMTAAGCDDFVSNFNYCTDRNQPENDVKYFCGVECGLCGKPALNPCVDTTAGCEGTCGLYEDPMLAEVYCAKTCGYCTNPN